MFSCNSILARKWAELGRDWSAMAEGTTSVGDGGKCREEVKTFIVASCSCMLDYSCCNF